MPLKNYLSPKAIILGLSGSSKEEILRTLSVTLCNAYPELEQEHIFSILKAREDMASTAIGKGIAVPHAKTNKVDRIYGALGISREGIDFDSPDHKPTHIFFVLISPTNQVQAHLKALSSIMQLFRDDQELKEKLTKAKTVQEAWDIISSMN